MRRELLLKPHFQDAGISLREIRDHAATQAQRENLPIVMRASAGSFMLPLATEMLVYGESGARAAGVVLGGLGVGLVFDALVRQEEAETVKRALSRTQYGPSVTRVPQAV